MALPAGAATATITVGVSTDIAGTAGTITGLAVRPECRLVWAATGQPIEDWNVGAIDAATATLVVLADQDGVVTSGTVAGAPALVAIRSWPMVAVWWVKSADGQRRKIVRRFPAALLTAGGTLDLDLLPAHGVVPPATVTYAQSLQFGGGSAEEIAAAVAAYLLANPPAIGALGDLSDVVIGDSELNAAFVDKGDGTWGPGVVLGTAAAAAVEDFDAAGTAAGLVAAVELLPGPEGPAGADGAPGADGLPGADGDDGREVELQTSATHVQWRYVGDVTWTDLIALSAITGPAGVDGDDGLSVELQTTATHIQWRLVGGTWADLVALSTITGPAGADGEDGAAGADGADGEDLTHATPQTINPQTGTAYTLQASDAGKVVTLTNSAAITLTIPGDVFTAGQRVDCLVADAGMVTAVGSSCTVNGTPSLVSRAQWSAFTVLFTSATTAVIIGDLAAA